MRRRQKMCSNIIAMFLAVSEATGWMRYKLNREWDINLIDGSLAYLQCVLLRSGGPICQSWNSLDIRDKVPVLNLSRYTLGARFPLSMFKNTLRSARYPVPRTSRLSLLINTKDKTNIQQRQSDITPINCIYLSKTASIKMMILANTNDIWNCHWFSDFRVKTSHINQCQ